MRSFSFNLSLPVVKEAHASQRCSTPADVAGLLADTSALAQEGLPL